MADYNLGLNIPLEIKQIFLRFAQAYFSDIGKYLWQYDVSQTKIIIADKHSADIGVALRRPSIILARGDLAWSYLVRGQRGYNASNFINMGILPITGQAPNVDTENKTTFTDLLQGTVIYHVLSKSGLEAEHLANSLFIALTAHQDDFRKSGFSFKSMAMGAEQAIKQDAEVQLAMVPVQIGFTLQQHIVRDEKFNNVVVYVNDKEVFESFDFEVITNGTQIQFNRSLVDDSTVIATYKDAITLATVSEVELVETANPLVWTIPDSGAILGYYEMLTAFEIHLGADDADDWAEFEDQTVLIS